MPEVVDDGDGFDPDGAPPPTGGTGLRGMRELAAAIGAELVMRTRPGDGTRVRVVLPLATEAWSRREPVRVLLVEDHVAVREAIAQAFRNEPDFEVVAEAASLAEARGKLREVDVAVIDLGLEDRQAIARLTPRERDVLALLAEGLDSQGIADRLHITIRTERNHVANVLAQLGVHAQLQALVFTLRHGLIEIR